MNHQTTFPSGFERWQRSALRVGLPPLIGMFNANGTAYAADRSDGRCDAHRIRASCSGSTATAFLSATGFRRETGAEFRADALPRAAAPLRNDIHVISGIDNPAARVAGPGNTHHKSMSALVSGMPYTGRGAGGPSIDQVIAAGMRGETRFRSLQVGVCQESHGENIHRNLSWAGYDRALPPEMIPQNLFDRLFGVRDESWVDRKKSVLDAVREDVAELEPALGQPDRHRLDEHLTSVRDLERAIASLPPDYGKNLKEPEDIARPHRLSAHRQDPIRSARARLRIGPNARRVVHADQVPEPDAASRGSATRNCVITTTRTPTATRLRASASCVTSAAGTSRSSRISCSG